MKSLSEIKHRRKFDSASHAVWNSSRVLLPLCRLRAKWHLFWLNRCVRP